MKKCFLAFILSFGLLLCACADTGSPALTPVSIDETASPAPQSVSTPEAVEQTDERIANLPEGSGSELGESDGVSYISETVFYPEGADESTALFTLCCELPVFSDPYPNADEANGEISEYKDELLTRVSEEYLPYADGESAAGASVTSSVRSAGGYTNVFLLESATFGEDNTENTLGVIVLGESGERLSLASAAMVYDASAIAAQQIFNLSETEGSVTYGDITVDSIESALDIYSLFFMADSGYGVIFPAGAIAPEEDGMLSYIIPKDAFYPECVGEAITAEEYEAVIAPLNGLSAACAADFSDFDSSNPSPYTASAFMTRLFTSGNEGTAFVSVDKSEYEAAYNEYFASTLPDGIYTEGDGTYLSEATVMVPVYPHTDYVFRIDSAEAEGDTLSLFGMICCGTPGTADTYELTAATAKLERAEGSESGFIFKSLSLG